MMKISFILITLSFPLLSAAGDESIHLRVGEEKVLHARGRVQVEKNDSVQVHDRGTSILVKAVKPGRARIRNGDRQWSFQVVNWDDSSLMSVFQALNERTLGLSPSVENGIPVIRGQLHRCTDWRLYSENCENRECHYRFQPKTSASLKRQCLKEIRSHLKDLKLPLPEIRWDDRPVALIHPKQTLRAELIENLQKWGIESREDSTQIENRPLIQVAITVAEIHRNRSLQYGISWPGSLSAQVLPRWDSSQSLMTEIKALEAQGEGRVLASPTLLGKSGEESEFLAGGEFPVPIVRPGHREVVWKRYGIFLKIVPRANFGGRISLRLETEVSSLAGTGLQNGIPSLNTYRLSSHFDLDQTKTIALSGLLKNERGSARSGLPFLSDLPLIGPLFGSKDFLDNKSELIVFVRPQIIFPEDQP